MSKLYTYIVTSDSGLAPNPFWGWCTLAVCTPNHQKLNIQPGDWIAGFLDKSHNYNFLYAMVVTEILDMNDYYKDPRFSNKKPKANGTLEQQCGDNFYYLDGNNKWQQQNAIYHTTPKEIEKDTRYHRVYVAKQFWYLGRNVSVLPCEFLSLVGGRGTRVNHPAGLAEQFKNWVQNNFSEGISAQPHDLDSKECGPCPSKKMKKKKGGCVC